MDETLVIINLVFCIGNAFVFYKYDGLFINAFVSGLCGGLVLDRLVN